METVHCLVFVQCLFFSAQWQWYTGLDYTVPSRIQGLSFVMCDATVWQPCAPELTLPLIPKLLSGTALLPPQAFQKTNPLHPQAEDTQKCTCTHTQHNLRIWLYPLQRGHINIYIYIYRERERERTHNTGYIWAGYITYDHHSVDALLKNCHM